MDDFINQYVEYRSHTESPKIYHRWCALTGVGAMLGRNYWFEQGPFTVFPNIYAILMGTSGARKSAAIKLFRPIIASAGYENFAADKSSPGQFFVDLMNDFEDVPEAETNKYSGGKKVDVTNMNLWGDDTDKTPKEVLVLASEFEEFMQIDTLNFSRALGDLWDWHDETTPYRNRFKNSGKIAIWQPTISILGGITPEQFARVFPPEIIGRGFFSRLLLIYGEDLGRIIAFPTKPTDAETSRLAESLRRIRAGAMGSAKLTDSARSILESIYSGWPGIDDIRFVSYGTRRFTQLLKLCLITSAARGGRDISDRDIITANTYLWAAERLMPKALGEFGKSKLSDVAHKIMELIDKTDKPLTMKDIYTKVARDLERATQCAEILQSMVNSGRIQATRIGFLPLKHVKKEPEFVDWKLLTEEERGML